MPTKLPGWQKNTLRLLAWTSAVAVLWALWQDLALAQGQPGAVEEVNGEGIGGFLSEVLRTIFTFDTHALMVVLGKPEYYVAAFIVLNVIVFTETGLLIGFFLPGDSLLVVTGFICSHPECKWNLPFLLTTLSLSAIIGDTVGYWIGYKSGPKLFSREKSFFFHKDHLLKAKAFYEKHGGKTIILARFVPFLRTFAPVVAGIGRMEYRTFLFFNVFGGVLWVFSMVLAGYFLPSILNPVLENVFGTGFEIQRHIEKVVLVVVFLSVLPIVFGWLKSKMSSPEAAPESDGLAKREPALSVK